jgi:NAD+ kinase
VTEIRRVGLVVHPTRDVDAPVRALREWARARDVAVAEIPFAGGRPDLAEEDPADGCGLIVAIGGDGTTLAAIRAAARARQPVLGVACGSLGALTAVAADDLADALDRVEREDWNPRWVPALRVLTSSGDELQAFNDLAIVRQGEGQLRIAVSVNDVLYARTAGDGCVISTPVGSSAYTIAAGGPLLDPELEAIVYTPLPTHGGFAPALVAAGTSELELVITPGYAGARLELDGRVYDHLPERLTISLQPEAATIVSLPDREPHLTGLRRRGIITDSPRILADDASH